MSRNKGYVFHQKEADCNILPHLLDPFDVNTQNDSFSLNNEEEKFILN